MDEAVRADRVIVLDDGAVILYGKPSEIFAEADRLRSAGLDLPQCSDLVLRLRKKGIDLQGEINTVEMCAEVIANAFKNK
jgi:energy-coupling factor transport system ATP-binding protein